MSGKNHITHSVNVERISLVYYCKSKTTSFLTKLTLVLIGDCSVNVRLERAIVTQTLRSLFAVSLQATEWLQRIGRSLYLYVHLHIPQDISIVPYSHSDVTGAF